MDAELSENLLSESRFSGYMGRKSFLLIFYLSSAFYTFITAVGEILRPVALSVILSIKLLETNETQFKISINIIRFRLIYISELARYFFQFLSLEVKSNKKLKIM